jgi:hypothetical protein
MPFALHPATPVPMVAKKSGWTLGLLTEIAG